MIHNWEKLAQHAFLIAKKNAVSGVFACNYEIIVINIVADYASCGGTPECSGHGECIKGVCSCRSHWAGSDCSVDGTIIINISIMKILILMIKEIN